MVLREEAWSSHAPRRDLSACRVASLFYSTRAPRHARCLFSSTESHTAASWGRLMHGIQDKIVVRWRESWESGRGVKCVSAEAVVRFRC